VNADRTFKPFHAKILLFGEHLVNLGCDALSMPYSHFHGKLENASSLDTRLLDYFNFLIEQNFEFLDLKKLKANKALKFSSNIPEGYGCGSSGALVAACYDLFQTKEILEYKTLQQHFSNMESFFHGVSSGADPLVSFLDQYIRFRVHGELELIGSISSLPDNYKMVLVDSGNAREGKELIQWFMQQSKDKTFENALIEVLIPHTQTCIDYMCGDQNLDFITSFKSISNFQFQYMQKMIPDHIIPLWQSGLASNKCYLKICGAGGGGFFIALIENGSEDLIPNQFATYSLL